MWAQEVIVYLMYVGEDSKFLLPVRISGAHVLKPDCNFRIGFSGKLQREIPAIIGVIIWGEEMSCDHQISVLAPSVSLSELSSDHCFTKPPVQYMVTYTMLWWQCPFLLIGDSCYLGNFRQTSPPPLVFTDFHAVFYYLFLVNNMLGGSSNL